MTYSLTHFTLKFAQFFGSVWIQVSRVLAALLKTLATLATFEKTVLVAFYHNFGGNWFCRTFLLSRLIVILVHGVEISFMFFKRKSRYKRLEMIGVVKRLFDSLQLNVAVTSKLIDLELTHWGTTTLTPAKKKKKQILLTCLQYSQKYLQALRFLCLRVCV